MIRLITAAVLAPGLWLLIKKAPPVVFDLVAVAIVVIASWECYRMFETRGGRPLKWFGLASVLALTWSFAQTWPHFDTAAPLAALGAGALVLAMWHRTTDLSDAELSSLGFRRIAGRELIYRHSALRSDFYDEHPSGMDVPLDFAAEESDEEWVWREWEKSEPAKSDDED